MRFLKHLKCAVCCLYHRFILYFKSRPQTFNVNKCLCLGQKILATLTLKIHELYFHWWFKSLSWAELSCRLRASFQEIERIFSREEDSEELEEFCLNDLNCPNSSTVQVRFLSGLEGKRLIQQVAKWQKIFSSVGVASSAAHAATSWSTCRWQHQNINIKILTSKALNSQIGLVDDCLYFRQ